MPIVLQASAQTRSPLGPVPTQVGMTVPVAGLVVQSEVIMQTFAQ
jgi:hypothetical protein